MWRRWKATGAMPPGRALSSSSLRPSHQRSRSSRASSRACNTARCTAGTSLSVPRSHGSGCSILFIHYHPAFKIRDKMARNKQSGGVAAVILAAGMSRRMGGERPKQLLRMGGKTLLERALENVRASQVSEIVLVLGANANKIKQQV